VTRESQNDVPVLKNENDAWNDQKKWLRDFLEDRNMIKLRILISYQYFLYYILQILSFWHVLLLLLLHLFKLYRNFPILLCSRFGQILHTRLRTESSSLKDHLFKRNLESDSFCTCKQIESSHHFLLKCPIYPRFRNNIFINISGPKNSYDLSLWNPNISDNKNCNNFVIVQDFIIKSKRFVQVLLNSWWWRLVAFALYNGTSENRHVRAQRNQPVFRGTGSRRL
jgi:hypothetical protein